MGMHAGMLNRVTCIIIRGLRDMTMAKEGEPKGCQYIHHFQAAARHARHGEREFFSPAGFSTRRMSRARQRIGEVVVSRHHRDRRRQVARRTPSFSLRFTNICPGRRLPPVHHAKRQTARAQSAQRSVPSRRIYVARAQSDAVEENNIRSMVRTGILIESGTAGMLRAGGGDEVTITHAARRRGGRFIETYALTPFFAEYRLMV